MIVRADGLRVRLLDSSPGQLAARIEGDMSGEVVVQAAPGATVTMDGKPVECSCDPTTGCMIIGFTSGQAMDIRIA